MLEIGEIISALEDKIDWYENYRKHNFNNDTYKLSQDAVMNVYKQFKKQYDGYYPFKWL